MKINGNTKVSKVISENKGAIEAIASLNPHFTKLRNPILRRLLAPRVTIGEAAKIGKCNVEEMLAALVKIGFEVEKKNNKEEGIENSSVRNNVKESFLKDQKIVSLDVRPILAKGEDPFSILQKTLKKLEKDEVLEVLIDFEPIPLIRIQEKKGYLTLTVVENGLYHTYFKAGEKEILHPISESESIKTVNETQFNQLVKTYPGKIINLDVRHLEMPEPLVKILESIEILDEQSALKVFHKKVPQHLLPELENRNLNTFICPISEGNVMMFIVKK